MVSVMGMIISAMKNRCFLLKLPEYPVCHFVALLIIREESLLPDAEKCVSHSYED
jgi:hypothetical protein